VIPKTAVIFGCQQLIRVGHCGKTALSRLALALPIKTAARSSNDGYCRRDAGAARIQLRVNTYRIDRRDCSMNLKSRYGVAATLGAQRGLLPEELKNSF